MSRAAQNKSRIHLQVEASICSSAAFLTRKLMRKGDGECRGQYVKASVACSATATHNSPNCPKHSKFSSRSHTNTNKIVLYEIYSNFQQEYSMKKYIIHFNNSVIMLFESRSGPGFDPRSGQVSWVRFFGVFPHL